MNTTIMELERKKMCNYDRFRLACFIVCVLLFVSLVLLAVGCAKTEVARPGDIILFRDRETGLCFAKYIHSISYVPCEDIPERLLRK